MDKFIVDLDNLLDNLEAEEVNGITDLSQKQPTQQDEERHLRYFHHLSDSGSSSFQTDDGPSGIFYSEINTDTIASNGSVKCDEIQQVNGLNEISTPEIVPACDEVDTGRQNVPLETKPPELCSTTQKQNLEAIMKLFDEKATVDVVVPLPTKFEDVQEDCFAIKSSTAESLVSEATNGTLVMSSTDEVVPDVTRNDPGENAMSNGLDSIVEQTVFKVAETSDSSIQNDRPARPSSLSLPLDSEMPAEHEMEPSSVTPYEAELAEAKVGTYRPFWIPDSEALSCMLCATKFTLIKRKHHCRGCGKVVCSTCSNFRAKLAYLENRDERVCAICFRLLSSELEDPMTIQENSEVVSPNARNPSEYCSTVPPISQASSVAAPPPTVFVPVGVLKKKDQPRGAPKQVVFSDGIRPGCDLSEDATASTSRSHCSRSKSSRSLKSPPVELVPSHLSKSDRHRSRHRSSSCIIADSLGPLHPVIENASLQSDPSLSNLFHQLRSKTPVTFFMTKNLHVQLQLVHLECCAKSNVWCFTSKGLATVGQDEICVLLERTEAEDDFIPRDVFRLFNNVYDSASKGVVYSEMSHILFMEGLFGCKEFSGFLFIRPTLQCMSNLVLPTAPYLVALLIQKFEVPWVKVFPLRLLFRLGHEFSCYPCPVISYRQRKAAFCEIGHTILNVLADFRNYQYTIPTVSGVTVGRHGSKIKVSLPKNRYESIVKVLSQNNEHVLALGGNFNFDADAHFACVQNEEGQHLTQLIVRQGCDDVTTTGASFIVFSGALKSTSGLTAKASVVEDGILVQINSHSMSKLKAALRDMKDYTIECGKSGESPSEIVSLEWDKIDTYFNVGVISPIDGRSLEGVTSVRIHNGTDYAGSRYLIRWTEVFFIENFDPGRRDDVVDPTKISRLISNSFCVGLCPHLEFLVENSLTKIGLRITLDPEQVGYEAGSGGSVLPSVFANDLDAALVPVMMGSLVSSLEGRLVLELIFHVILK